MTKMKIYDVTISFKKDGVLVNTITKRYISMNLDVLYAHVHGDYPKGNLLGPDCIRCVGIKTV